MQRDLAISVIDRCLLERKPIQCEKLLENHRESIIVTKTDEEGKVELYMLNKKAESIFHGLDKPFIELISNEKIDPTTSSEKLLSLVELLTNYKDNEIQDQLAKVTLCNSKDETLFVKLSS